jgi:HSP20 family protein
LGCDGTAPRSRRHPRHFRRGTRSDARHPRAERNRQPREGDEVVVSERAQGSFTRQLFLGEGLDAERIGADYQPRVLTVTIPVGEQVKPRKVEIASGSKA